MLKKMKYLTSQLDYISTAMPRPLTPVLHPYTTPPPPAYNASPPGPLL